MNARATCYMIHTWLVVIVVPGDNSTSTPAGGNSDD